MLKQARVLSVVNAIILIILVGWNYAVNALKINGNTVGSLSDKYDNLFTPAGYAFAIWGLIFTGLIVNAVHQLYLAFGKGEATNINELGTWLILANILNGLWLFAWLKEYTGISVLIMLIILFSLSMSMVKLRIAIYDAPKKVIYYFWWPIAIYAGWISVATIANVSAFLSKTGFEFGLSEINWTILMIGVALTLNIFLVLKRNLRAFALVACWAFAAIAVRHYNQIQEIFLTAIISAIGLFLIIAWSGFKKAKTVSI